MLSHIRISLKGHFCCAHKWDGSNKWLLCCHYIEKFFHMVYLEKWHRKTEIESEFRILGDPTRISSASRSSILGCRLLSCWSVWVCNRILCLFSFSALILGCSLWGAWRRTSLSKHDVPFSFILFSLNLKRMEQTELMLFYLFKHHNETNKEWRNVPWMIRKTLEKWQGSGNHKQSTQLNDLTLQGQEPSAL